MAHVAPFDPYILPGQIEGDYDIPVLALDRQAAIIPTPFLAWGTKPQTTKTGCWHFYVDDYRFNAILNHPERVLNIARTTTAIVEPNISLPPAMPRALAIAATWTKRYISRLFQIAGVFVVADVNVPSDYFDLNLIGIPAGWSTFATRGYAGNVDRLLHQANRLKSFNPNCSLLVYGGGHTIQATCHANGWNYIPDQATQHHHAQS